jgi:hypothetical protein
MFVWNSTRCWLSRVILRKPQAGRRSGELPLPASGINVPESWDRQPPLLFPAIHSLHIFQHNFQLLRGLGGLPELTQIWRPKTLKAVPIQSIMALITRTVRPFRHLTLG